MADTLGEFEVRPPGGGQGQSEGEKGDSRECEEQAVDSYGCHCPSVVDRHYGPHQGMWDST